MRLTWEQCIVCRFDIYPAGLPEPAIAPQIFCPAFRLTNRFALSFSRSS